MHSAQAKRCSFERLRLPSRGAGEILLDFIGSEKADFWGVEPVASGKQ
jgi:hypothetical protein